MSWVEEAALSLAGSAKAQQAEIPGGAAKPAQPSLVLGEQPAPDPAAPPDLQADPVRLTITRPGTTGPLQVTLRPETFWPETVLGVSRRPDNSWDYLLDAPGRIAQVRLATRRSGTCEELARVLGAAAYAS